MGYVLFHSKEMGTPHKLRWYRNLKGAKIGMKAANRNAGYNAYQILDESVFDRTYVRSTSTTRTTGAAANSKFLKNLIVDQGA